MNEGKVAVGRRRSRLLVFYRDWIEDTEEDVELACEEVAEGVQLPDGTCATWPLGGTSSFTLHSSVGDACETLDAFVAPHMPEIVIHREIKADVGGTTRPTPAREGQSG